MVMSRGLALGSRSFPSIHAGLLESDDTVYPPDSQPHSSADWVGAGSQGGYD